MDVREIPEGYSYRYTVDLRHDRKAVLICGIGQMLTILGMGLLGLAVLPNAMLSRSMLWIQIALLILCILVCAILHELLRGLMMRLSSSVKTRYRFVGWRLYAVSAAYFTKNRYGLWILLPAVILITINAVLLVLASQTWTWMLYTVLIMHLALLWEDGYLAAATARLPHSVRLRHEGASVEVYTETK